MEKWRSSALDVRRNRDLFYWLRVSNFGRLEKTVDKVKFRETAVFMQ